MAKDPAFLFYYDRFLAGTITMTDQEVGQYIRLMCIQANKGYLTKKDFTTFSATADVINKFEIFEEGKFRNKVLEDVINQRKNFTESRRRNRNKADNDQVKLYLMINHMNGHIKCGSSNKPERRLQEIRLSTNNPQIDLLWVSEVVKQTEEAKLHAQFKAKRTVGEWFELTKEEIDLIKKQYPGTTHINSHMTNDVSSDMTNHMTPHMVNVNVNVNEDVFKNKKESNLKISKPDLFQALFSDDIYVEQLSMTHKGKDLRQAFEECFTHFSNAPNPPQELWEWRQKMNTWLTNTKNGNHKKSKSKLDQNADTIQYLRDKFGQKPGTK